MPRYRLSWWERNWWEVEIEARDKLQARQKWENWSDDVSDNCHETEFLDRSDEVEIEVIRRNANINSIN